MDRHVEVFSWGGLTSRSKIRVLWLALLPFLFANLAGWMCSSATRTSAWRFRLHRLTSGLCALALTVNAALIAVLISADVNAYQTPRAGLARNQWWLAPLRWHFVAGHPARQVTLGVLVVVLFVLALLWVAKKVVALRGGAPAVPRGKWPAQGQKGRGGHARQRAGRPGILGRRGHRPPDHLAARGRGRRVPGHRARGHRPGARGGSPHASALGWAGIALGAATVGLAVGYLILDALDTPAMAPPGGTPVLGTAAGKLRSLVVWLLVPAGAGLICSGGFAWLQPGAPSVRAADLPGMAGVTGWTALAIAVALALALISMLLGLRNSRGTLTGGPWVTLMLGFATLNILLLGAEIWVAHLVGAVTSDAATALSAKPGQIYLPYLITSGVPLLVWAAVLAIVAVGVVEAIRWLRATKLPEEMAAKYDKQAADFRAAQGEPLDVWYWSGLDPFPPPGDKTGDKGAGRNWQRQIARVQFLASAPHGASWLLWTLIGGQIVMAVCVWQLHMEPPVLVRNIGIALAGLVLPALAAFLYAAWSDPTKRRTIGVLWDVGTFWPRSYHPLSPPCYTERAIPDLQRRMWWLHDNGGRVVLVAHSQGAVLATAALIQPACRPVGDRQPALVTFGSPVAKLYGWGFPAYFDPSLVGPLVPSNGQPDGWRNFYYPTDPIGGPVTGGLPGSVQKRVDQEFLDPADCYYVYGQAPPAAQGHSGYWADRRVWDLINELAASGNGVPPPAI